MSRLFDPGQYKKQLIKSNIAAFLELQKLTYVVEQLRDNYQESKDACLLERYYMLKEMITIAIDCSHRDLPRNIFVAVNVLQTKQNLERELQELHKIDIGRKTDEMKKQINRIRSLERKYENSKRLCCFGRYGAMKEMVKETIRCLNDPTNVDVDDGRETDPLLSS